MSVVGDFGCPDESGCPVMGQTDALACNMGAVPLRGSVGSGLRQPPLRFLARLDGRPTRAGIGTDAGLLRGQVRIPTACLRGCTQSAD